MNVTLQRHIFIAFFRSGMLGYGGGPSTIPLVHKEVVDTYKWMTDEEFSDVLALGNTLPGPIATKMAGYIGYQVGGWAGMFNALIASVIPTVLLMVGLIGFLYSFRDSPLVQGMTQAVAPVIAVMLFMLAFNFFKQSGGSLGWGISALIGLVCVLAFEWLHIHPAIVIAVLLVYGFTRKPAQEENKNVQKAEEKEAGAEGKAEEKDKEADSKEQSGATTDKADSKGQNRAAPGEAGCKEQKGLTVDQADMTQQEGSDQAEKKYAQQTKQETDAHIDQEDEEGGQRLQHQTDDQQQGGVSS